MDRIASNNIIIFSKLDLTYALFSINCSYLMKFDVERSKMFDFERWWSSNEKGVLVKIELTASPSSSDTLKISVDSSSSFNGLNIIVVDFIVVVGIATPSSPSNSRIFSLWLLGFCGERRNCEINVSFSCCCCYYCRYCCFCCYFCFVSYDISICLQQ